MASYQIFQRSTKYVSGATSSVLQMRRTVTILVYYQGHISPGIYSRAFVEGRLTEEQLDINFQSAKLMVKVSFLPAPETDASSLDSTISMGQSYLTIYQARFLKYLDGRGLKETSTPTRMYAFPGDGEMDGQNHVVLSAFRCAWS